MKLIIVVSLYLIGVCVSFIWAFSGKDKVNRYLKEEINKNPDLAAMSNETLNTLIFIVIFRLSLFWPISLVYVPYRAAKRLFK